MQYIVYIECIIYPRYVRGIEDVPESVGIQFEEKNVCKRFSFPLLVYNYVTLAIKRFKLLLKQKQE